MLSDFPRPSWVDEEELRHSGLQYVHTRDPRRRTRSDPWTVHPRTHRVPRQIMSLQFEPEVAFPVEPMPETSHRGEDANQPPSLANSVVYAAERWGDRLQAWRLLGPDGANTFSHLLLMVRCALINLDHCARLDHHFRRQHDLRIVADMMNHRTRPPTRRTHKPASFRPHGSHSSAPPQQPQGKVRRTGNRRRPPVKLSPSAVKLRPQSKQDKIGRFTDKAGGGQVVMGGGGGGGMMKQEKNNKKHAGVSVAGGDEGDVAGSWDMYAFLSVVAMLVFVMDASYRVLRLLTNGGRALVTPQPFQQQQHQHQQLLDTLTDALHRWHQPGPQPRL